MCMYVCTFHNNSRMPGSVSIQFGTHMTSKSRKKHYEGKTRFPLLRGWAVKDVM